MGTSKAVAGKPSVGAGACERERTRTTWLLPKWKSAP